MIIDYTISVGNLIEVFAIIGGGLIFVFTLRGDVASLKDGAEKVQEEIKKIAEMMIKIAVQDERLNAIGERLNLLDHRYDEIRNSEGLSKTPHRHTSD